MKPRELTEREASDARSIQRAVDEEALRGGRVVLPEAEIELDRGLALRSGVELAGRGPGTVLRAVPARVYRLLGFQVYGMLDLLVQTAEGLEPGMTVAIRDAHNRDFRETFARLTWVEGNRVGLDTPLQSDYLADGTGELVTSFPLLFGIGVRGAVVRDLCIDGNAPRQPDGIGSCRGAAVYFIRSRDCLASDTQICGFFGEGLGFQMCRDMRILRCSANHNTGNGYHPGAGSTGAVFEGCTAEGNREDGLFFCARATRISVRGGVFRQNGGAGVSIGLADCHNLLEGCTIEENHGPGVLVRDEPAPTEVHSCAIMHCSVRRNGGPAQICIEGQAHDILVCENRIEGQAGRTAPGVYAGPRAQRIFLRRNRIEGCHPEVVGDVQTSDSDRPDLAAGTRGLRPEHYRHLDTHQA